MAAHPWLRQNLSERDARNWFRFYGYSVAVEQRMNIFTACHVTGTYLINCTMALINFNIYAVTRLQLLSLITMRHSLCYRITNSLGYDYSLLQCDSVQFGRYVPTFH
jgi:hypothetical protein